MSDVSFLFRIAFYTRAHKTPILQDRISYRQRRHMGDTGQPGIHRQATGQRRYTPERLPEGSGQRHGRKPGSPHSAAGKKEAVPVFPEAGYQ